MTVTTNYPHVLQELCSTQYQNHISEAFQKAADGWRRWLAGRPEKTSGWQPTPVAESIGRRYAALEGGQVSAPASQGGGVQAAPAGAKAIPAQALKGWAQGRYLDSARMGWVR